MIPRGLLWVGVLHLFFFPVTIFSRLSRFVSELLLCLQYCFTGGPGFEGHEGRPRIRQMRERCEHIGYKNPESPAHIFCRGGDDVLRPPSRRETILDLILWTTYTFILFKGVQ